MRETRWSGRPVGWEARGRRGFAAATDMQSRSLVVLIREIHVASVVRGNARWRAEGFVAGPNGHILLDLLTGWKACTRGQEMDALPTAGWHEN